MKYIIYGINRTAKDFTYIFDDLEILYLTDEDVEPGKVLWGKYPVQCMEAALADTSYDQIIICDFEKTEKEKRLQERGLVYQKDYVYEEDFFARLDEMALPENRKIAVWGTGNMCSFLLEKMPQKAEIFIDSYKKQDIFRGRPVFFPDEIEDWTQYYLIIAVMDDCEIRSRLRGLGLQEKTDYLGYREFLALPSMLLRQTLFDRAYYDLNCTTMCNHLEILADGATRSCCTTFVAQGLENIFDRNVQELWHSKLHKILCLSTENRTFSFCDKSMCPLFVAKERKEVSDSGDGEPYGEITPFPETLSLGYDSSCNLSCITCRKGLHYAKGEELESVNRITEKAIKEYLPHCKFLIMAGSGEVFASPAYRKVYESAECNPKYIRLLSNGTLFTPANWERFVKGKNAKIMLTASVDAATKETYGLIRQGGNFDMLKKNMEFASQLRKNGELCYFRMNFVVQRENFREMIPFVEWGQALGVDEIFFTKILNWGTYTPEEFAQISMMEQDGITPKPELKEVLEHPVMRSSIVDMGTIQFAHKIDEVDMVENYYMWELEKRGGKIFI